MVDSLDRDRIGRARAEFQVYGISYREPVPVSVVISVVICDLTYCNLISLAGHNQ